MTRTRRDRSPAPKTADRTSTVRTSTDAPPFTRWTGIFGGAGAVVAVSGFYFLAQGSIALAPFLLAIAFFVLFPLALVK